MITKKGSMPVIWVARVWVLARSRCCTSTTVCSSGATPRMARPRLARSWLKAVSSRVSAAEPAWAWRLPLSLTTSSRGTSPRRSWASKSAGTFSTGLSSLELRSRASKSAGAACTV